MNFEQVTIYLKIITLSSSLQLFQHLIARRTYVFNLFLSECKLNANTQKNKNTV